MAKINISVPDDLLRQVDTLADELGRSRSGLVAEATARYVTAAREAKEREERRVRIDEAMADAKRIGEKFGPFDAASAIRKDRDRGHEQDGDQ